MCIVSITERIIWLTLNTMKHRCTLKRKTSLNCNSWSFMEVLLLCTLQMWNVWVISAFTLRWILEWHYRIKTSDYPEKPFSHFNSYSALHHKNFSSLLQWWNQLLIIVSTWTADEMIVFDRLPKRFQRSQTSKYRQHSASETLHKCIRFRLFRRIKLLADHWIIRIRIFEEIVPQKNWNRAKKIEFIQYVCVYIYTVYYHNSSSITLFVTFIEAYNIFVL